MFSESRTEGPTQSVPASGRARSLSAVAAVAVVG